MERTDDDGFGCPLVGGEDSSSPAGFSRARDEHQRGSELPDDAPSRGAYGDRVGSSGPCGRLPPEVTLKGNKAHGRIGLRELATAREATDSPTEQGLEADDSFGPAKSLATGTERSAAILTARSSSDERAAPAKRVRMGHEAAALSRCGRRSVRVERQGGKGCGDAVRLSARGILRGV